MVNCVEESDMEQTLLGLLDAFALVYDQAIKDHKSNKVSFLMSCHSLF